MAKTARLEALERSIARADADESPMYHELVARLHLHPDNPERARHCGCYSCNTTRARRRAA